MATTITGAGTRTIARLWQDGVERHWPGPAYLVQEGEDWREVSWDEAAQAVEELANGLLALGIRKGDAFSILGSTRLEWVLFDFALGLVGAVGAPIYMNSSPKDTAHVVEHSEAVGVLCEDESQRSKLEGLELEHVLTFADLDDLRARGRAYGESHPGAVAEAAAAIREDDLFTYIYTSGTTGPPKACMITHRNYYEMADEIRQIDDFTVMDDTMLLFLPLAHNFGRLMHLHSPHVGYTTCLLPRPVRSGGSAPGRAPDGVPERPARVREGPHGRHGEVRRGDRRKRRLIDWALRRRSRGEQARARRGEPIPRRLALRHRIADKLVYSKVKERLGGRIRICVSGGAPLAKEIIEFFHALGILILEGYGLTECTTGGHGEPPDSYRFGTVGPPLPGVRAARSPRTARS